MKKYPLIVVSLCAVALLVVASFGNVVGYQMFQPSNKSAINVKVNQRELLFQTICDIVNNKEIQHILLKSQMSRGIFPISEIPVITKNQIRQMYFLGYVFSGFISKTRVQSMIGRYQFNNQEMQKEISDVIHKNTALRVEINQLQKSECDCESISNTRWSFPVICIFLFPFFAISAGLLIYGITEIPIEILTIIGSVLNCFWYPTTVSLSLTR